MNPPSRAAIEAELKWGEEHKIESFYPDSGPLRRERYAKHLEFFSAGASRNERLFMAANRVGKTEGVGAYETTLHLTGNYPPWWLGRRFTRPISAWAAGQAANAVEAGIFAVEQMMYSGKLKAFNSLSQWYSELRSYRRDQNGKVVKERDHCMDAMRYLIMSGLNIMQRQTAPPKEPHYVYDFASNLDQRWMQ